MIGWGTAVSASSVINGMSLFLIKLLLPVFIFMPLTEFPWNELGDKASVCDVGGGIGNITLQLAKTYPTLDLILQDLPERILQAKNEVWPKECPEAIMEKRIKFEPIDFLSESPVQGCNVYYVSNYCNNFFSKGV